MGTLEIQIPPDFKKRCGDYIAIHTGTEQKKAITPSEKQVNREIWWALDKIYREALRQEKGKPFEVVFQVRPIMGAGIPPIEVRQKALLKVQELGGIKIIDDKTYNDNYGVDFVYILELIQPKFDEIYEKYEELNQEPAIEKPRQETASTTEKIKEQVAGELNLNGYSEDNLRRFNKITSVILNQIELDSWSRLTNIVKIPLATLEREGFNYEEMRSILGSINKINNKKVISVLNERPYKTVKSEMPLFTRNIWNNDDITKRADEISRKEALHKWLNNEGRFLNVSEDDLKNKLVLELTIGRTQDTVVGVLSGWHESIESKLNPTQTLPKNINNDIKHKITFNGQTGVIRFGDTIHKFQRGTRGDKDRISLFKRLWDEKKYFKNGVEKIKGKPFTPEFLAVQLNITENATTFSRNEKAKNRFFGIIKGTNRILRDKGFPAKVERKSGIQLVIIEK